MEKNVMEELTITIWEDNALRMNEMEPNLKMALKRVGLKARIQLNSEVPLLSRQKLLGRTPAVQVNDGDMWFHTTGVAITSEQFEALLYKLRSIGLLEF